MTVTIIVIIITVYLKMSYTLPFLDTFSCFSIFNAFLNVCLFVVVVAVVTAAIITAVITISNSTLAPLYLRTLWRYTNDDVIIIIIISVKKLGSAYIFQIVVFREYFGLHTWQLYTVTYSSA